MDGGAILKIRNPKSTANVVSKLFFTWMVKPCRKILNNNLESSHLYKVLMCDSSEKLADKLEENWKKEVARAKMKKKKPKLVKAIVATFFWSYMIHGGVLFVQHIFLRSMQPVILAYLISLFGKNSDESTAMYSATAALVGVTFLVIFAMHHAVFGQSAIGMRLRVAISSLIYRKTLKLNPQALNQTSTGQIINLLSNDVTRFDLVVLTLNYLWILPFQIALVTFLCYMQIGVASLVGVAAIALLSLPVQGYLGKLTSTFRVRVAEKCDHRVTLMGEIISGIQVIKMYAWEKAFQRLVDGVRAQEMKALTVTSYLRGVYLSFMVFVERTALFLTLTCYTLSGNVFLAEQVFPISHFFNLLQLTMSVFFPLSVSYGAETLVAIERIERFLMMDEIETWIVQIDDRVGVALTHVHTHMFNDVTCQIKKGSLCAVVGPVGSGKTALLRLLLNELRPLKGTLSVQGSVSFAPQEPWLFPGTIRENILFGSKYDKKLYSRVVNACALRKDFSQFPLADKTLVGERGAGLSGGQKARVNLARAMYKEADVYLLDDPLAAVDSHVGKHLFEECVLKYLKGKTRLLVTHQRQYLEKADVIVVVDKGKVEIRGSYWELEGMDDEEAEEEQTMTLSDNSFQDSSQLNSDSGHEEGNGMTEGSLSLHQYIKASNNSCLILLVIVTLVLGQTLCSATDYWVTLWTQQEILRNQNVTFNNTVENEEKLSATRLNHLETTIIETKTAIYIYSGLIFSTIVVTFVRSSLYFKLTMIISKNLHTQMFRNLLIAHMRFFTSNPAGRILNRFSKDLGAVDEILPRVLLEAIQIALVMCGILVMVIISNYYMIPVIIVLGFIFTKIRSWFVSVTKSIKHLEGITKSPVFSHLNSSLHGITTIRAFKAEENLRRQFDHHQDVHTSAWFLLIAATSAFGLWLDLVCLAFIACTSFSFIILNQYGQISGSLVGLAISQSLVLTGMLQYGVRQSAEVVNQLTSVERILQYNEIEKEGPLSTVSEKLPPPAWPTHGFILLDRLFLQYSPSKPPALKNLNLEIQAGEKIGIVGRTGAGKSSLIAALFRLVDPSGTVYIDGVDTRTLGVHDLRRRLSIIPQEPVLFSATVRQNVDPFGEYSDKEIWDVLEEVELKDVVSCLDEAVGRNGSNFSVGQRQLVCLARAVLKNNKILVMDEATANTDDKTDALIQKMIRKKFHSCTVLTVAHRLHTVIDSDKIMVMENGEIVEFDHPYLLLQKPESKFFKMVLETGLETSTWLEEIALNAFLEKRTN